MVKEGIKMSFELKEEHMKILKSLDVAVYWQDCEQGAPAIDPKYPYGNSDVYPDLAKVLGVEPEDEGSFTSDQEHDMDEIWKGTEQALGIVMSYIDDRVMPPGEYAIDHQGEQKFDVTSDHLKVLRSLVPAVQWLYCGFGAPEINPKSPYGNSLDEIYPHVGKVFGIEPEEDGEFSWEQKQRMDKAYRGTDEALKAVFVNLDNLGIKLGTYEYDDDKGLWEFQEPTPDQGER
jgi:hypothetical protein